MRIGLKTKIMLLQGKSHHIGDKNMIQITEIITAEHADAKEEGAIVQGSEGGLIDDCFHNGRSD